MLTDADRKAVVAKIQAIWDPTWGGIGWPNDNFKIPKDSRWATVSYIELDASRASLGNDFLIRTYGIVQIDLYEPNQAGTGQQRVIAEAIHDEFLELNLVTSTGTYLEFGVPSSRSPAPNEVRASNLEDNWSRLTINLPFVKNVGFIK